MLNYASTAQRAGVTLQDLNELSAGRVTAAVAARLGVTILDADTFIRGTATNAMAARLGTGTPAAGTELAHELGREGVIGLLFGLVISV